MYHKQYKKVLSTVLLSVIINILLFFVKDVRPKMYKWAVLEDKI